MSLIRRHVAVLQAWACLALVLAYRIALFVICVKFRYHILLLLVHMISRPCNCFAMLRRVRNCRCYYYYYYYQGMSSACQPSTKCTSYTAST